MFVFIIKKIRKEKNITRYGLSKSTGLGRGYLMQLEDGKKNNPSLKTLYKIAYALNVNIKDLFYTKFDINDLKEELYKSIDEKGITHEDTIKISQLIDLIINIDLKEID